MQESHSDKNQKKKMISRDLSTTVSWRIVLSADLLSMSKKQIRRFVEYMDES